MLDLKYIKDNSLYVAKYEGYRTVVKGSAKIDLRLEGLRSVELVAWRGQPDDLKDFWKAYEYAIYVQDRKDLRALEDFYDEWLKNPDQFRPEHRIVISKLSNELEAIKPIFGDLRCDVLIKNYDKRTIGNHYLENWLSALKLIEDDFDVVEFNINATEISIIIQCDNEELLDKLNYLGNKCAIDSEI